jgi:hypothetical protein
MSIRLQVLEYSRSPVVDGVIVGVKIIGTRSRNGRVYPQDVLGRAIGLYENAPVFMDHPDEREQRRGSRQTDDHFGSLQNIQERFDGKIGLGLFGDLHVRQTHPWAQFVIESDGRSFGLSHNVVANLDDEKENVLEIISVNSVDLVTKPAATDNLFEESEEMKMEELEQANKALTEKVEALGGQLATILEAVTKKPEKKPARVTALERVNEGDDGDDALPTYGLSHEDFLAGLNGISEGAKA